MDVDTGEIRHIYSEENVGFVEQEPDYIKVYVGTQLCLNNMDPKLAPYIIAFGKHMTFANAENKHIVQTTQLIREDVAREVGVSDDRVKQVIRELVKYGIFIPVIKETTTGDIITQKRVRGAYFVNPWVIAKGSWKDIKQLRQQIDFVKGTTSYVIEDKHGTKRIQVALPDGVGKQLTLEDFQEKESTNE